MFGTVALLQIKKSVPLMVITKSVFPQILDLILTPKEKDFDSSRAPVTAELTLLSETVHLNVENWQNTDQNWQISLTKIIPGCGNFPKFSQLFQRRLIFDDFFQNPRILPVTFLGRDSFDY